MNSKKQKKYIMKKNYISVGVHSKLLCNIATVFCVMFNVPSVLVLCIGLHLSKKRIIMCTMYEFLSAILMKLDFASAIAAYILKSSQF